MGQSCNTFLRLIAEAQPSPCSNFGIKLTWIQEPGTHLISTNRSSTIIYAKVRCLGNSSLAREHMVNQLLAGSSDRQVFRNQMRRGSDECSLEVLVEGQKTWRHRRGPGRGNCWRPHQGSLDSKLQEAGSRMPGAPPRPPSPGLPSQASWALGSWPCLHPSNGCG